ncbi:universal stress protein (plasmid) [Embleya sp. NBC_00888]|uniref:universal stress protein n=1 Tax=Embleya sp. NBC_00888 TaxID=2975960 RepID=UPI002F9159EC|nr:universal stress protein [Embleya sp. NBC_00888]
MDTRPPRGTPPCVVVGVDPDPAVNHRSVRWAAHEAALRGAALHLVYAWEPTPAHRAHYAPMHTLVDPTVQRRWVRELLDGAEQAAHHVRPDLTVVRRPIEGPVVPVLLGAASEASLLVLGGRPRHADRRPLGPVTRECLRCARCPVVTVGAESVEEDHRPISVATHMTGVTP